MKLSIEKITYSINSKLIVDGIDLGVEEGSFVGLVGPNGCGKSTLLKNIYKVYTPDSGKVYIDGKDYRVDEPLSVEHYAVGFKLGDEETAKIVTNTLKVLYENGTVENLCKKYEGYGVSFTNWALR